MSEVDSYVPYHATAEVIVEADGGVDEFVHSLFPDATSDQIAMVQQYAVGKYLDGIHTGLGLSDSGAEPMKPFEAYRFGAEEGYQKAIEDMEKMRGQQ